MREILFRAKRIDNGEWVEGLPQKMWGEWHIINPEYENTAYPIDPETLCQYTGLTDKNGKRIWENDIVSNKWCFMRGNSVIRYGEYKDFHMPEKFKCGNLGFYLEHVDMRESTYTRKDMMYFAENCEVIGNIFDNLELLGEDLHAEKNT